MRIAITGIGLVTPHGATVVESWSALQRGDRAVRRLSLPEVDGFVPPTGHWLGAPARWTPRQPNSQAARFTSLRTAAAPVLALAFAAVEEAVQQARLDQTVDPHRVGCVFGTSKGELHAVLHALQATRGRNDSSSTDSPLRLWDSVPPNIPAVRIAEQYGWYGAALTPVAACATGLVCLIRGAALLRDGVCDAVVVGSSDASLHPAVLASFRRLGVLATDPGDPLRAGRPFDAARSGFAVGEGAGTLVLERWDHARARGAPILAEWVDGLQYADPRGLTLLDDDPVPLVRLIGDLLHRTGLTPVDLDAVSLHGTGTRINDRYEALGLARVCGPALDQLTGFGIKGGIGHLLGAAGSVETVAAVCVLRDQILPPTVNCDQRAEDCPIPLTLGRALARPVTHLLKLSLGFGGHLAAGLLRRVVEPPQG